MHRTTTKI